MRFDPKAIEELLLLARARWRETELAVATPDLAPATLLPCDERQ